jgi:apolipoprotein N-acyltransferase
VFEAWRFARARRSGGPEPGSLRPLVGTLALAVLAALAAATYGSARTAEVERAMAAAPSLRLGLVQANADVLAKRRDPEAVYQAHLTRTRALLAEASVDLVVWPETVYSRGIAGPLPVSGELVRGGLPVPLLFGAASVRTVGERRLTFNSALLVGADGSIRSGYDKNLLVPFAESVPLAALAPLFPHAQRFGAGTETPPLALGPWRIATPICFEAVEPAYVRRMVAASRPHLLVSLANDGWFGESQEPRIHLAVARLRAVEHRRALVRATNSGISAVVDPLGRVTARSRLHAAETLVAKAPLLDGPPTLYGRAGDWPGVLAAGLVGLMLVLPRPRRRPVAPRS